MTLLAPNPLLADPTNLALQRRAWAKALKERNAKLRDAFLLLLLTLQNNPGPAAYAAFAESLRQAAAEQLAPNPYWFRPYVLAAYKAGLRRSYADVRPQPLAKPGSPGQPQADDKGLFLLLLLGNPLYRTGLDLLYARSFTALRGLGEATAGRVAAMVAQGLLEGWTPKQLAAAVAEGTQLGAKRAALVAETELTRAHAEGQLDALEALGVKKVGAVVEFVTVAGRGADEEEMKEQRVCPKCRALAGKVFTIKQARGVIPRHFRCRCRWYANALPRGDRRGKGTMPEILRLHPRGNQGT